MKDLHEALEKRERMESVRAAESMKLFESDGMIHYGKWRQWWSARYSPEGEKLLAAFRKEKDIAK